MGSILKARTGTSSTPVLPTWPASPAFISHWIISLRGIESRTITSQITPSSVLRTFVTKAFSYKLVTLTCVNTGFSGFFFHRLAQNSSFQKPNQNLPKLQDFVTSKLNFSENNRSLDARDELILRRNLAKHENSRKFWKKSLS